jgi:hypothetical protein
LLIDGETTRHHIRRTVQERRRKKADTGNHQLRNDEYPAGGAMKRLAFTRAYLATGCLLPQHLMRVCEHFSYRVEVFAIDTPSVAVRSFGCRFQHPVARGRIMIRTACHCGAVRFEIAEAPEWVLDCNCTLCRRTAALWSYYRGEDAKKLLAVPARGATEIYSWLDHDIGSHRCKTCG